MKSKKYSNNSNQYYIKALFLESQGPIDKDIVLFTLGLEDTEHEGKPIKSLQKMYLESRDPSELTISKEFDSWTHWLYLRNSSFLKDYVDSWQTQLIHQERSEAYSRLKEMAEAGSLEANKFLLNAKYDQGIPNMTKDVSLGRGRPSNRTQSSVQGDPKDGGYMGSQKEDKALLDELKQITGKLNS
jgi:hypothetical protein